MTLGSFFRNTGRKQVVAAAILAAIGLTTAPRAADAGGVSPGAAVGIGLGAFALGSVLANRYYQPYYYPYSYYYPPTRRTIRRRRIIRLRGAVGAPTGIITPAE